MAQGKIRRKNFLYGAGIAVTSLFGLGMLKNPKASQAKAEAEATRLSNRIAKEPRSVPYGERV
jgi:uncharacterized membrane protein YhaH (DUF805 family)